VRIAQIAPLYERVPPASYGGTERVVSYLTEELVALGHDVTLFASGDSITRARLVAPCTRALRLDTSVVDQLAHHMLLLDRVFREYSRFDILHFHIDYLHFPLSRLLGATQVTTLHGRLDLDDLQPLYREFGSMPLVSISQAQRDPIPWANWQATVHHGLPLDLHAFRPGPGGYLAFLGRVSPEKRVDRAIEIAQRAGWPIRIAAKVDRADREYFESTIQPLLSEPGVEYVGEIGEVEKTEFLGNAAALLFPIDWCEPFGLVMIEALACGTPVIAWRRGSVGEVITDGVTGFVVDSIADAVTAVSRIGTIDRPACRAEFERRFTVDRMTGDYLRVYEGLLRTPRERPRAARVELRTPTAGARGG
jgi:glycosyltransferase involved in cell wall biosynthesis